MPNIKESIEQHGSPYDILGVPQTATDQDINKAFRKAALSTHPDKVSREGLTDEEYTAKREEATEKFKTLNEAKDNLLEHRAEVDQALLDSKAANKGPTATGDGSTNQSPTQAEPKPQQPTTEQSAQPMSRGFMDRMSSEAFDGEFEPSTSQSQQPKSPMPGGNGTSSPVPPPVTQPGEGVTGNSPSPAAPKPTPGQGQDGGPQKGKKEDKANDKQDGEKKDKGKKDPKDENDGDDLGSQIAKAIAEMGKAFKYAFKSLGEQLREISSNGTYDMEDSDSTKDKNG